MAVKPASDRAERLEAQLSALPQSPGVYLFRSDAGDVLYVGKAKSLRSRVRSYFRREAYATAKTAELVERIDDYRVRLGAVRDRGALPRAEPDQAAPADVQHPAARRQVVPVHRRHGRRRVPARHVHPRAAPKDRAVLRPLLERQEGARDARRPEPRVPVPPVRGPDARPPLRRAVPRLPHRPVRGPVRGLHLRRGVPRRHRLGGRVPVGPGAPSRTPAREGDEGRLGSARVRGRRPVPKPAHGRPPPVRAAGGRPPQHGLGRHPGRRLRRGHRQRPALPPPRRTTLGPARLLPRERRRPQRVRRAVGLRPRVLRRAGRDPAARSSSRAEFEDADLLELFMSDRRGSAVEVRSAQRGEKRRLADMAAAERAPRARARHDPARAHARPPDRGDGGAARAAQPRVAADADRVLRRLEPGRDESGRIDGRVRGRRREEVRLPQVRDPLPGPRRLRDDRRGRAAAGSRG